MNLVIDEGNTRTKVAIFDGKDLMELKIVQQNLMDVATMDDFIDKTDACIISSVKYGKEHYKALLDCFGKGIYLDHLTPLPIKNQYKTKETLGKDRIAAAVAGNTIAPDENVLVIDAGTALTFEYITSNGIYLGGNISPGLEMRLKALNKGTKMLPQVSLKEDVDRIGTTTSSAIRSGVVNGMVYEIDGVISEFIASFEKTCVLGTGGNINFFDRKLKNSIFVLPNLVLTGLNRILLYNV